MSKTNQYVMLISSLPPAGELFEADQTPISYVKLESRLKDMLEEEDLEKLYIISDLVAWVRLPMEKSDIDIIESAEQFCANERNASLRKIVESFLDIHTVMSALRQRQLGLKEPPQGKTWGYGSWITHIERNWRQPDFKLVGIFSWIPEARKLIESDSVLELEKLMLKVSWDMLGKIGNGHYFDFEAVVVYVLKWDIIKRWLRYDSKMALERFHDMTDTGIGDFAKMLELEEPQKL